MKNTNIKFNFVLNFLYQFLHMGIMMIMSPYLSRMIGADGVGTIAYHESVAAYFVVFIMLGLNNYGNRSIAFANTNRESLSRTFWNIYTMQLVMGIVASFVYFSYIYIVPESPEYKQLALIYSMYVLSGLFDINWFFFGIEQFKLTVTRNTGIKLITLLCTVCLVKNKEDVAVYAVIVTLSTLISQVAMWGFLRKFIDFVKPDAKSILLCLKPNLILFIPVIAVKVYKIMDKVMLGILSTASQTGFYDYSEKIVSIPMMLITALGTVMLPRISNLISQGKDAEGLKYLRDSLQFSMFSSCGMAFGLAAIAENFVPIFLGKDFQECDKIIPLLSVTIIFVSWANVIRTQYLIPRNKNNIYIISVISGAVLNLVVNSLLIGKYGATGAAIGTIAAEFIVMFIQTWFVKNCLDIKQYIGDNFYFLFSGAVMYIAVYELGKSVSGISGLIFQIALGVIVYGILSVILLFIFNKERGKYIIKISHKVK